MKITRRSMLKLAAVAPLGAPVLGDARPDAQLDAGPADHTLRIATGLIELAPNHIVSTTLYNGEFPGPVIRLREGRRTTIDLINETDTPCPATSSVSSPWTAIRSRHLPASPCCGWEPRSASRRS